MELHNNVENRLRLTLILFTVRIYGQTTVFPKDWQLCPCKHPVNETKRYILSRIFDVVY